MTMLDESYEFDFISRYFAPWVGIDEDPVTGSAHTVIAPMWFRRANERDADSGEGGAGGAGEDRRRMSARQCSPRGGNVGLRVEEETKKLYISGEACVVLDGTLRID